MTSDSHQMPVDMDRFVTGFEILASWFSSSVRLYLLKMESDINSVLISSSLSFLGKALYKCSGDGKMGKRVLLLLRSLQSSSQDETREIHKMPLRKL